MTTIAVRAGVIAADSRETLSTDEGGDRVTSHECQKLFRFAAGTARESICGTYGMSSAGLVFLDWYESSLKAKRRPKAPQFDVEDDFGVVVLTRSGLWHYDRFCRPEQLTNEFYAFGSGAKAALGALWAGAAAEEAVKIACRIDPWSAEPVIAWSLGRKPTR